MNNNIKAAVVGLGVMGKHHARVYNDLDLLSFVCDTNKETAKQIGEKYQVPFFYNIEDLIEKSPTHVSIASPTPFHFEQAKAFLSNNCNVLLEKPMCNSLEDARELAQLADDSSLVCTVGYIEKYNPAFKQLSQIFEDGLLGEITSVNIKRVGGIPRSADNVVLDLMTHDICLALELLKNKPAKLFCHRRFNNGVLDSSQALFDFGRCSVTCESNWVSPIKIRTIQVTGTQGYCETDLIKQEIVMFKNNSSMFRSEDFNKNLEQSLSVNRMELGVIKAEPLKEEIQSFINNYDLISFRRALDVLEVTLEAAGIK